MKTVGVCHANGVFSGNSSTLTRLVSTEGTAEFGAEVKNNGMIFLLIDFGAIATTHTHKLTIVSENGYPNYEVEIKSSRINIIPLDAYGYRHENNRFKFIYSTEGDGALNDFHIRAGLVGYLPVKTK